MDQNRLLEEARRLLAGELQADEFVARLRSSTSETGDATLDIDRAHRCGFPEVVFAEGKPVASLVAILEELRDQGVSVLATRVSETQGAALCEHFGSAVSYHRVARTVRLVDREIEDRPSSAGNVCVVTAGTSDMPVAEEARETLHWMGVEADLIPDVGVAGPHRLIAHVRRLRKADAIVVAAGMEGALPSVVAGHVACPVFAVPTSVGYGASFGGVAALLGMLNSCAANVAVVNIDAGFKAGYLAGMVATKCHSSRQATDSSESR